MSAPRNARSIGSGRGYDYQGQTVPSVTTILSAIAKPALLNWYAKMAAAEAIETIRAGVDYAGFTAILGERQWLAHKATATHQTRHKRNCDFEADALKWLAGAPTRYRDTAGKRGTDVHEAAEKDFDILDVPVNARKAYGSYLEFVAAFQPRIIAKEFQVFNAYDEYGGSGDFIAEIVLPPWDRFYTTLVDIKSSGSIYHETRLQLAAYKNGRLCIDGENVDLEATAALASVERCAILHLTDEGYSFVEVEVGQREFDEFLHAKAIYEFLARTDKTDVGVVIRPVAEAAA